MRSYPVWIAIAFRTITESLLSRAAVLAMKLSPNSHKTRPPPKSIEYALSPPIHLGSFWNGVSASGQSAADRAGFGPPLPLPPQPTRNPPIPAAAKKRLREIWVGSTPLNSVVLETLSGWASSHGI